MPMLPGRGLRRELSRTGVPAKFLFIYSPSWEGVRGWWTLDAELSL
jgi:hypothetical protein